MNTDYGHPDILAALDHQDRKDLENDLLATSESVYHRNVAAIQMEAHAKIQEYKDKSIFGGEMFISENPGTNVEQVNSAVMKNIKDMMQNVHMRTALAIFHERQEKDRRDEGVRHYCSAYPIES